jgi:glycosyltransferase involved in cell wall biosynthesis
MKMMTAMYTLKRGGAYERFVMLVEAFLERCCEVHCLSLTPIPVEHPYFHNHVVGLRFKTRNELLIKLKVILLLPLYSFLIARRERIDLFVAFGLLYAFIQGIPKWVLKRQMVTLIRGDSSFGFKMRNSFRPLWWVNSLMEKMGLIFSDQIITVTTGAREEIKRKIRKWRRVEIDVLFNNIPSVTESTAVENRQTREQWGIPLEGHVVVTGGVVNRGKNIESLVKSLPAIEIDSLYLLIAGEGSAKADFRYKEDLQTLTEHLGLGEKVIFTGWLDKRELWKVLCAADLFVLPSENEGMPNTLLEALSCNVPCMGNDIPGVREILLYDELIFDSPNEQAMAEKIRKFFSNDAFRERAKVLCAERRKTFVFDWREKAFQIIVGQRDW